MSTSEGPADRHTSPQAVLVAQRFVALADTLVDDFDVVELLDRLVTDCVDLIDVSAAGILLQNNNRVLEVVASSDEASRLMEVFQLESHSGPCVEAVRTGQPVTITNRAELARRWPAFASAVGEVGYSAVYALPLRLRRDTIGALNIFLTSPEPLSEDDVRLAQAFADVATIGILQQRTVTRASLLAEQLQLALNTRISVEQAKGVLAEYGGVEMGVAFEALRTFARARRTKLGTVAHQLVSREIDPAEVIPARDDIP
jgi:GAF domain-containing protein